MAIGVTTTLATSVENFDAIHAAMLRHPMPLDVGLIVHISRATADGVEVIEVWDSQEAFQRFMQEIVPSILSELRPDQPVPEARTDMWEIRGLVIPAASVAI